MSGKEINNNEAFAAAYERLPQDVKDRLSFKNTESREEWQKRRSDAKPMAKPWFNQGVTIMGPAGYFVAETQINREHARVDTYLALANAAHIVLCVNAHDALVQAAEEALNALIGCCIPAGGVDDRKAMLGAQALLRSALSKSVTSTEGGAR